MLNINETQLHAVLPYPALVDALAEAFRESIHSPPRHHYQLQQPGPGEASTLLLMPAWSLGTYTGVKIITVSPENKRYGLPAIQGVYLLFDGPKGIPLAQLDAPALTARRTAAASALASRFLSRPESRSLLMVGTGTLAPHLIRAHAAVRPIEHVVIWGRNRRRAAALADELGGESFFVESVDTIEEVVREADIVSCATLAMHPLIKGDWLRPGQHLDLVGSYKPDMREADDEAIRRARLFADCRRMAPKESGDLAIPVQRRIITIGSIKADLYELCRGKQPGRRKDEEITLFKSVGLALEDLAAARLAYQALNSQENSYPTLFD